jgi:hypothetical protein
MLTPERNADPDRTCNFCRSRHQAELILKSNDPMRGLQVSICLDCSVKLKDFLTGHVEVNWLVVRDGKTDEVTDVTVSDTRSYITKRYEEETADGNVCSTVTDMIPVTAAGLLYVARKSTEIFKDE